MKTNLNNEQHITLNRKIEALYDYLGLSYYEEGYIKSDGLMVMTKNKVELKDSKNPTFVVIGNQCLKVKDERKNLKAGKNFWEMFKK